MEIREHSVKVNQMKNLERGKEKMIKNIVITIGVLGAFALGFACCYCGWFKLLAEWLMSL